MEIPAKMQTILQQRNVSIVDTGIDHSSGHSVPGRISISVSILNYRRPTELQQALRSVLIQDHQPVDIVVIDNHSGPDLLPWVRQLASSYTLIELSENIGISARNLGIDASSGEIIVTLDNDVSFISPSALLEIAKAFDRHPEAGCVTFGVNDPSGKGRSTRDWCHPWTYDDTDQQDRQTTFISECACAFRRSVFDTVAPYWDELFINMEGADLALRMLDAGYEIWYTPTVEVQHSISAETRERGRDFYHNPRNLILLAYRDIPTSRLFTFLAPRLVVLACCSLIRGYFPRFMAGIRDGLNDMAHTREARRPVHETTMDRFNELRSHARSLPSRLYRHWKYVGRTYHQK